MKSRVPTCIGMITLFAALEMTAGLAAQVLPSTLAIEAEATKELPLYTVIDLGTLGGTASAAHGINNKGILSLGIFLPGNGSQHAAIWHNGTKTDLGTLGGPNSFTPWRPTKAGVVTGGADTTDPDPLGEDFCFFGTNLVCRAFVWQNGVMTVLPTLGGNNAFGNAINDFGLVGGVAENTTLDSTCSSQEYQAKPVLWENGVPQELPTFDQYPDGYINGINNYGQAVGGSGDCYTAAASQRALLWQKGKPMDLGNLGGKLLTDAYSLNDQGMVIGASDLPGDTNFYLQPFGAFSTAHAFLWFGGVMRDLGALPGDVQSLPNAINNRGQIVGLGSRAILWQNGELIDLNTLVPGDPFSRLYLLNAWDINENGEIVGQGLTANGKLHAFLAIPCDNAHSNVQGCKDGGGATASDESEQVGDYAANAVGAGDPPGNTPGLRLPRNRNGVHAGRYPLNARRP